ncbi:MAG TPA: VWA domain-containing protein [Terracidiphilus sp.]|nr:VWA domain-containing protein [Terracidiphilus sp.]
MRRLSALSLMICLASGVAAQTIGGNSSPNQPQNFTLKLNSQLVVEDVVVKDKKGNFIQGLTAKNFKVTEDGVPQTVRICEHQQLVNPSKPLPPTPPDDEDITIYKRLVRTQISPETEGTTKYRDRRLLALYFDMSAMPPDDQYRALAAAEKFVRTQMTASDLVAILRFQGGSVDILQDFTADRNRILSILQTLIVGEGQGNADSIDDASSADTGAAFGQDDSEFNVFNTDRQLSALETAAKMLGRMSEKKSLIYFASGLRLNGVDNQAQLHATIDAAIRAGVSFWPIDARGLVAGAPLGDATQGSPGNVGMYSGTAAEAVTDRFQISQDTMYSLAADTGGKALFDNNDLSQGIVQAQRAVEDYYIVGYYTSDDAQNGRFRRVKITLDPAMEVSLDYRQGYYANKTFDHFNAADKERQLEDALMLGDPITDLTIAMEIDYFQLNRAEYFVPIIVKIPGRELALAKRFGAEHTLIDFVCEIKDEIGGITVTNVRDYVDVKLSDATAAELAKRPVEYDTGFTLLPGRYSIKFLARDDETGRIGTYQTEFVIPNLNKELTKLPISSVVLSSQKVNLKDAIYNTTKGKQEAKDVANNPLVEDGVKLIPSVTRVFNTGRDLYVYLQAYDGGPAAADVPASATAKGTTPLVAFVSLYRDQKKAFDSSPVAVTPEAGSRLGVVPLRFSIKLGDLAPGEYQCEITVIDPSGRRAAFWVNPIMLVK